MKVFFDSSALAKRYIDEKGSDKVEEICRKTVTLTVSIICLSEIISALNRLRREKILNKNQYKKIKSALIKDLETADLYNISSRVVQLSIYLLERYTLRAMDSFHIGCAIVAEVDLFVSSDQRQLAAAKKARLKIQRV